MKFKYARFITPLTNCPPGDCKPADTVAYRFVFDDLNDRRNFAPSFIIEPSRHRPSTPAKVCCSGYGLSLYDSLPNAEAAYRKFAANFLKFEERVGTNIAEGNISKTDGVVTPPNHEGHFDLHEYEGVQLRSKFRIVKKV
jgi:hypothetical protein